MQKPITISLEHLILFIFLVFCFACHSQNEPFLVLQNDSGKSYLIKENSRIVAFTSEGKFKGHFQFIDKEQISIDLDTILIEDIEIIGSNALYRKIIGTTFIITGIATPIASIIYDLTSSPFIPTIIWFAPIGAAQIIVGYGHVGFKKRYKIGEKWTLRTSK